MTSKKIDINKAGIEELSSLVGVGRAKAEAIIESRKVSHLTCKLYRHILIFFKS